MAWSTRDTATQLVDITTEQFFDDLFTLNPGETAHLQISVDFPSTPTDHAIIAVYTTLHASSEDWDEIPYMEFVIDNANDTSDVAFTVSGIYKFRVGVRRSGTTDTLAFADLANRLDGVSL
jgi:hypothetical protein